MLTVRIIPCLDVRDGKVVKGVRFQGLQEAGDPAERSLAYQEQGADEIILLDVSATPEGRGHAVETVKQVREVLSIPLTVGGGIRRVEDAGRLLDAGADKVAVNSAAVADPTLINRLAARFGSQCTVVAVDAARRHEGDGWEVVVRSGKDRTGIDAVQWAEDVVARGCGEILLTSWDRDGTKSGYDLALLTAVSDRVNVPVIASGGAAHPAHLVEALEAGANAVLAASIFHYGEYTVGEVKAVLTEAGIGVRP
jgi:cyclase